MLYLFAHQYSSTRKESELYITLGSLQRKLIETSEEEMSVENKSDASGDPHAGRPNSMRCLICPVAHCVLQLQSERPAEAS